MNTNNLQDALAGSPVGNFITFEWLTGLNLLGVVFVLTFTFGYLLRRVERVPNSYMWLLIPVVTALYSYLASAAGSGGRVYVLNAVFGFTVATIAVLLVVLAHDRLLAAVAAKWPWLNFLVSPSAAEAVNQEKKDETNEKDS